MDIDTIEEQGKPVDVEIEYYGGMRWSLRKGTAEKHMVMYCFLKGYLTEGLPTVTVSGKPNYEDKTCFKIKANGKLIYANPKMNFHPGSFTYESFVTIASIFDAVSAMVWKDAAKGVYHYSFKNIKSKSINNLNFGEKMEK